MATTQSSSPSHSTQIFRARRRPRKLPPLSSTAPLVGRLAPASRGDEILLPLAKRSTGN